MLRPSRWRDLNIDVAKYLCARAGKILSACLTAAIVATSIALIAYISACLAWLQQYRSVEDDAVTLNFANYSQTSSRVNATWTNDVHYDARALYLDDIYAMLVAGILGAASGLCVLAMPLYIRQDRTCQLKVSWQKVRPARRCWSLRVDDYKSAHKLELTTVLDATLALVVLIAAVIVWVRHDRAWWTPDTYSLPDHHVNRTSDIGPRRVKDTFESWNCGLYRETLTYSYGSYGYGYSGKSEPSTQMQLDLRQQCRHATSGRQLMVPLVALALARVSLQPLIIAAQWLSRPVLEFLEWKKHTREMREGQGTELDQIRAKREDRAASTDVDRDSLQELAENNVEIAELPGWRMSRGEMDGDAALTEMTGTEGGKELDAGIAAVEKDASEGPGHKT